MIFDIDIRYRSSGSTISVTYDIEEQRYRSFSYDIEVLATISKNYDIEETSISKSETSISGCQGSRCVESQKVLSGISLKSPTISTHFQRPLKELENANFRVRPAAAKS